MKWADKIDMRLRSPANAKRLKALMRDHHVTIVGSTTRPAGTTRMIVADEVDAFPKRRSQAF